MPDHYYTAINNADKRTRATGNRIPADTRRTFCQVAQCRRRMPNKIPSNQKNTYKKCS